LYPHGHTIRLILGVRIVQHRRMVPMKPMQTTAPMILLPHPKQRLWLRGLE
jgi:hypothetical protein